MSAISGIVNGTCPSCKKGKIFASRGNIFLFRAPKMNAHCSQCDYRFDKEPGYFLGAMYISYGLTILEMGTLFLSTYWYVPLWVFFCLVLAVMIGLSLFNYRLSRVIWIHIFKL